MDWSAPTLWWVAAGMLVALELFSGTFYLLMLALGCAVAAVAAHAGVGATLQVVAAALTGGGATAAWHLRRARHPKSPPAEANRDVNLDIGEQVQVDTWAGDGTTTVKYRGAFWAARHSGPDEPEAGPHVIVGISGNRLTLSRPPRR